MAKNKPRGLPPLNSSLTGQLAAAALLYLMVVWYFLPSPMAVQWTRWLIGFNWFIAAMGCFVLSRRWIAAFAGSLFAGAIYGFGPFAIGFAAYHPLAGVPLAIIPWLFCPAAFWRKWVPSASIRLANMGPQPPLTVTVLLSALPFLGIGAFFWLFSRSWIGPVFPLPVGLRLETASFAGLAVPITMRPHEFIFSFYHVPVAALAMGLCMYFASGRIGVMLIAGAAFILAFAPPVAQATPVVWALIPVLFGSVIVGLGLEGLAWAGPGDKKWLLFCAAVAAVITAGCAYLSLTDGILFRRTALLHASGLLSVLAVYALTSARLRLHPFRWVLLSAAFGIDLLSSGKQLAAVVF